MDRERKLGAPVARDRDKNNPCKFFRWSLGNAKIKKDETDRSLAEEVRKSDEWESRGAVAQMKPDLLHRQLQHFRLNNVVRLTFERMHTTCIYSMIKRWLATPVGSNQKAFMTIIFHEWRSQDNMFSREFGTATSDNFGALLPPQDADSALMNWLPVFAVHLPRPCGHKVVVGSNLVPQEVRDNRLLSSSTNFGKTWRSRLLQIVRQ